jgi:hypothetical protein
MAHFVVAVGWGLLSIGSSLGFGALCLWAADAPIERVVLVPWPAAARDATSISSN